MSDDTKDAPDPKDTKAEREPSPDEIEKAVEAIYAYGAALLREGKSPNEVEEALVAKGIERKTAEVVVDKLTRTRDTAVVADRKERGAKNMMIGGLICVVGIIITAATYSGASGGGRYVIAWGAIIFGAIRFFQGLAQSSSS